MRPFIVIKRFESTNKSEYQQLLRQYAMSFAFNAFLSCLFREVTPATYNKIDQCPILSFSNICRFFCLFIGIYSACSACGGCHVHILQCSITILFGRIPTCYCFHLCVSVQCLFCESNRSDARKRFIFIFLFFLASSRKRVFFTFSVSLWCGKVFLSFNQ